MCVRVAADAAAAAMMHVIPALRKWTSFIRCRSRLFAFEYSLSCTFLFLLSIVA
jgi:hypothetical protein